jgi:hypothetical protein
MVEAQTFLGVSKVLNKVKAVLQACKYGELALQQQYRYVKALISDCMSKPPTPKGHFRKKRSKTALVSLQQRLSTA